MIKVVYTNFIDESRTVEWIPIKTNLSANVFNDLWQMKGLKTAYQNNFIHTKNESTAETENHMHFLLIFLMEIIQPILYLTLDL
jgi:hypothetical protein